MKFRAVFKKVSGKFIRAIQKILLAVFLVLIYFLGLGFTLILAILFNRKVIAGGKNHEDSSWSEAQGYGPDLSESLRQS